MFSGISDDVVGWSHIYKNNIYSYNTITKKVKKINFNFYVQRDDIKREILVYGMTGMFAIIESTNRTRFIYFKTPLELNKQPVNFFQMQGNYTREHDIVKGNNDSMIIWFENEQKNLIRFSTVQLLLHQQNKLQVKRYELKNQYNITLDIACMWQMTSEKCMIVEVTQLDNHNQQFRQKLCTSRKSRQNLGESYENQNKLIAQSQQKQHQIQLAQDQWHGHDN